MFNDTRETLSEALNVRKFPFLEVSPTGVVLGEPGFDLGERGRRDRFGPRRGESLFPRESGYTKNSKAVTVVL